MAENRDIVPCYIAVCPTCQGIVMICVADPSNPTLMRDALKTRRECERDGLLIETLPLAEGKARLQSQFGHVADCAKDPRNKKKRRQPALAL